MKVFDCFTYFNENEILKIRLNELDNFVDYFVIVEASKTFTGLSKLFYLDDEKDILDNWSHKIIRVKIDFNENLQNSWQREFFQRNQIVMGLEKASDNDLILISDVDEIINSKIIKNIRKIKKPVQLDNSQYFWNFNWKAPEHCNQGARPVACKMKHLRANAAQELRAQQLKRISNASWHFSYFSDINNIIYKIESFAHTEYNQEEYKSLEAIKCRIENGIDPFDRFPLKYYEIDDTYPVFVQQNYK